MSETRKLAAILVADVVGYSRLAGADEDRTLARLRGLRNDLIDPAIAARRGRIVKRTGDGFIVEFRSVVDAARCAIEVQTGMIKRNAGVAPDKRIEFRVGVHLGDVVEESDGDLMGDGVNIAVRIESIAGPGGICLSGAAYEQVRDRVEESFVDLGEKALRNIARPVRVFAIRTGSDGVTQTLAAPTPEKPDQRRLSILVLPFANMSGDASQDYFVDGVTESLTTDLSRMRGMRVIARNTAFTFKRKAVDLKQIGRELNVRYVLEGSVQRGGNRMRVNVQLVDAESGNHFWADRFDKPVADLFDMQDEIVARLANQLGAELVAAEARRAEQAPNPDSMDLYFQGMAWRNKGHTLEYGSQARGFFERALTLDPRNVGALVGSASVDVDIAATYIADDRWERLASAETALTQALSLAPDHASAHVAMGVVQIYTNRAAQGIAECQRALALDPNLAEAHAIIGLAKIVIGRFEETETHVQEAIRLSPRDKYLSAWLVIAGIAKLYLGSDDEAVTCFRRSIEINRNHPAAQYYLAAALALLGRLEEAQRSVRAAKALHPDFTISRFRAGAGSDNPRYLAARERLCDGMRTAGVPK